MKGLTFTLALVLLTGFSDPPADGTMTFYSAFENVLGTSLDMRIAAVSENIAELAEQRALDEIDRLDNILSSYKDSEFRRWQETRDSAVMVSPELFEVLSLFDEWRHRTHGALSPSVGVGVRLWKEAEEMQRLPNNDELASAANKMAQAQWVLDYKNFTATHLSGEPLLLNSFVKSYVIGKASRQIMTTNGVTGCVVNIGGDIVVAGQSTETIRIADSKTGADNTASSTALIINNKSVATSGNYKRGYTINGHSYNHILDPRTALTASGVRSATVIANNGTDAGALATAFNIFSLEESIALAKEFQGVAYRIVTDSGQIVENDQWRIYQMTPVPIMSARNVKSQYEMTIELELARFEGRFRRPFVAVWIENSKKESVRTLALWYNKPRWLPDLKRWYSKNQDNLMNAGNQITSISSATRSPGRYTLAWDGLTDEGKSAPAGKYTVYIEAAREHGTYQLLRQEIEWNGKVKHFDLKGGVEITTASVDIHPAAQH
jgi:FAD:protein FMN transferase